MKKNVIIGLLVTFFLAIGSNSYANKNSISIRKETKSNRITAELKHQKNSNKHKKHFFNCPASSTFNITIGGYSYDITVEATAETCAEAGAIIDRWALATKVGLAFSGGALYAY